MTTVLWCRHCISSSYTCIPHPPQFCISFTFHHW